MTDQLKTETRDPLAGRNIARRWTHDNPMSCFEEMALELPEFGACNLLARTGEDWSNRIFSGGRAVEATAQYMSIAIRHLLKESDAQRAEIERLKENGAELLAAAKAYYQDSHTLSDDGTSESVLDPDDRGTARKLASTIAAYEAELAGKGE